MSWILNSALLVLVLLILPGCKAEVEIEPSTENPITDPAGKIRTGQSVETVVSIQKLGELWSQGVETASGGSYERASELIRQIGAGANEEHFSELVILIQQTFGNGDYRDRLLADLFANSTSDFGTMVDRLSLLETPADREAALAGLGGRIISGTLSIEASDELDNMGREDKEKLVHWLFSEAFTASKSGLFDQRKFDEIVEQGRVVSASEKSSDARLFTDLLVKMTRNSPEMVYKFLKSEGGNSVNSRLELMDSAIKRLALLDGPEKTMKFAVAEGAGIKGVMEEWLRRDTNAASEWIAAQTGEEKSQGAQGFAAYAMALNELDTARIWLKEVADDGAHYELETKINDKEKAGALAEVESNGELVIQNVVEEGGDYSERLFQVVFERWSEIDTGKAADWYWENEKKLSAPQRNQVAKIYMERAIELQDIEAAKGWLKFINEGDRASFILRLNESKR